MPTLGDPYLFAILAAVHRLRFPHFLYSLYKAPDQRSRALCNYFLIILTGKGNKDHDLGNQFQLVYPFRLLLLVPRLIADTLSALFWVRFCICCGRLYPLALPVVSGFHSSSVLNLAELYRFYIQLKIGHFVVPSVVCLSF